MVMSLSRRSALPRTALGSPVAMWATTVYRARRRRATPFAGPSEDEEYGGSDPTRRSAWAWGACRNSDAPQRLSKPTGCVRWGSARPPSGNMVSVPRKKGNAFRKKILTFENSRKAGFRKYFFSPLGIRTSRNSRHQIVRKSAPKRSANSLNSRWQGAPCSAEALQGSPVPGQAGRKRHLALGTRHQSKHTTAANHGGGEENDV